jgi:hypothetical protein
VAGPRGPPGTLRGSRRSWRGASEDQDKKKWTLEDEKWERDGGRKSRGDDWAFCFVLEMHLRSILSPSFNPIGNQGADD